MLAGQLEGILGQYDTYWLLTLHSKTPVHLEGTLSEADAKTTAVVIWRME